MFAMRDFVDLSSEDRDGRFRVIGHHLTGLYLDCTNEAY